MASEDLCEGLAMKVVINKCFGGFGLSTEAVKWLIAKNSPLIKTYTEAEYGVTVQRELKDAGDGFRVGWIDDVLYKDGLVYTTTAGDYENRCHKDLIAVIDAIGEDAASND